MQYVKSMRQERSPQLWKTVPRSSAHGSEPQRTVQGGLGKHEQMAASWQEALRGLKESGNAIGMFLKW